MVSQWTDERIEKLRQLAADNLSASQIASALDCGFTRNAVLGKMFRLGIQVRCTSFWTYERVQKMRKLSINGYTAGQIAQELDTTRFAVQRKLERGPRVLKLRLPRPLNTRRVPKEPMSIGIKFIDLQSGQCKYILGDVDAENTLCCGAESEPKQPYCEAHCAICFTINHPRAIQFATNARTARRAKLQQMAAQYREASLQPA